MARDDDEDYDRRERDDDRDADYDRPRRRRDEDDPPEKRVSILGVVALVQGLGSLGVSLIPCIGALGIVGAVLGGFLGVLGFFFARASGGRVGTGLPVASICVNVAAAGIAAIWIFVIASAANKNAPVGDPSNPAAPAFTLTAVELDREYDDNEPAADAKFKGKWVEVTGQVKKVTGDTHPRKMTLELVGTPDSTVDCVFGLDKRAELGALKTGEPVTVRGKCRGKVRTWVTLEDCVRVTPEAPKAEPPAGPPVRITATELEKEFDDNVIAAEGKYKGKVLDVSGKVTEIRREAGTVTVTLGDNDDRDRVDCEFAPANAQQVGSLKKGQTVAIRGTCKGEVGGQVVLEQCSLAK